MRRGAGLERARVAIVAVGGARATEGAVLLAAVGVVGIPVVARLAALGDPIAAHWQDALAGQAAAGAAPARRAVRRRRPELADVTPIVASARARAFAARAIAHRISRDAGEGAPIRAPVGGIDVAVV